VNLNDPAEIQTVGIIGAGAMGAGLAQVFLSVGCNVALYDASAEAGKTATQRIRQGLEKWATKGPDRSVEEVFARLRIAPNLMEMRPCQWIIEAVIEDRDAKAEVFRSLGRLCREDTVLATNTSSLSITWLGAQSGAPERVIGMHFFNPPTLMRLVEVVPGLRTAPEVVTATQGLVERLGKVPVLSRDRPGFIANRIVAPMVNEAICMLEQGVGSAEDLDQVLRLGMNHPMGPLELADFIGLDVLLAILEVLHAELGDSKFRPCPLLRKHVEAGWLGRKSGRGFYTYPAAPEA
jgi:3-hydroxybutyryl-CoA dehydrogenase